jgi:hypothetical protein
LTRAQDGIAHWPEAWSRDGRTLIYKVEHSAAGNWNRALNEMDLWMLSLDEVENPQPIADAPYPVLEAGGAFSPDGEWFAYTIGDGPAVEYSVWARPFPFTEERRRVSQEFGVMPLWSGDGQQLFYRPITLIATGGFSQTLRRVRVSRTPSIGFGVEEPVSIGDFLSFAFHRSFDVMPDGETFLVVLPANEPAGDEEGAQEPQVRAVLNWARELVERVSVP